MPLSFLPTQNSAKWSKVSTCILSVLSLIILSVLYWASVSRARDPLPLQCLFGGLGISEILVIIVVSVEIAKLLPMALGYSIFMLFTFSFCSIFWLCYGIFKLSSEKEDSDKDSLSLINFLVACGVMIVLVALYLLRMLAVMVVYKWSRLTDLEKIENSEDSSRNGQNNQNNTRI